MKTTTALKLSLLGAILSLGAFAKNDVQAKHVKDNAEFVEKAALNSKTEINISELALSQTTNGSVKQLAEKVIADHKKAFDSLKATATAKSIPLPFGSVGSGVTSPSGSSPGASNIKDDSEAYGKRASNDLSNDVKSAGEDLGTSAQQAGNDVADSTKHAANDAAYGAKKAGDQVKADVTGASPMISPSKDFAKAEKKASEKYNDLAKLSGEKFDKAYLTEIGNLNDKAISLTEKVSKDGWDSDLMTWANETLPTLRQHEEMIKSVKQDVKNARPSM